MGVFGTTTCNSRCAGEGGTCVGLGTDSGASNGLYYECGQASSGVATQTAQGSCSTVLGGNGCSEYTNCKCSVPTPICTEPAFAVGVFGTTTCASRCQAEGGICVGLGTDTDALNGLYFECGNATSGVATQTAPGNCNTILGGNGCSEYTNCRCYPF